MRSLDDDFKELLRRIRGGREIAHASFEPIFFLIFPPERILDVKRRMPAWTAKLKNDGWSVHVFSLAAQILDLFENAPLREIWLRGDALAPTAWTKPNQSLANFLTTNDKLARRLHEQLDSLEGEKKAILLVTDLEALHPYLRVGALEQGLQGKFSVPTVFFYPGERSGKSDLKFLRFYPADGNYRSVHVGG